MKLRMTELRQMVKEALSRTLSEAKRKPKQVPAQTEDSTLAARDRKTRATGYSHSPANDYSEPLGNANLYKSQGASNIGGFTGVGPNGGTGPVTAEQVLRKMREMQLRKVIRHTIGEMMGEAQAASRWMDWANFQRQYPQHARKIDVDQDGAGETHNHSGLPLHAMRFRLTDDGSFECYDTDPEAYFPPMRWDDKVGDLVPLKGEVDAG